MMYATGILFLKLAFFSKDGFQNQRRDQGFQGGGGSGDLAVLRWRPAGSQCGVATGMFKLKTRKNIYSIRNLLCIELHVFQ